MTETTARRSIAMTALLVLPFQVAFRAGEALLPVLLSLWFGRSAATDAFYLTWAWFIFGGSMLNAAFVDSTWIPILTEVKADRRALSELVSSTLGHLLFYGLLLIAVLGGLALGVACLRAEGPARALYFFLIPAFCVHLLLVAVRSMWVGVAHAHDAYLIHPIASGIGTIVSLALIALFHAHFGIVMVPYALALSEAIAVCILWAVTSAKLPGLHVRPTRARSERLHRFVGLVVREAAGSTITRVNGLIDQSMAAMVPIVGGGTLLRYAMDIAALPTTLLQATLLPVLVSRMSQAAVAEDESKYRAILRNTLFYAGLFLVAVAAVIIGFATPIVQIVFGHGKMDAFGVAQIAAIVPYAVVGCVPFGWLLILARAHVAKKNTVIMPYMGILNASLNALFNFAFLRWLGLSGLALSTSLMYLGVAVTFYVLLPKKASAQRE